MNKDGYKNNLFIAALPEDDAAHHLFTQFEPYLSPHHVTLLTPADLHVTLTYLRDVDQSYMPALLDILNTFRFFSERISVQKLRTYHSALALQVLPKAYFTQLNQSLSTIIQAKTEGGIHIDNSLGFDPHMTLCRGFKGNGLIEVLMNQIIRQLQPVLLPFQSRVTKIALMRKDVSQNALSRYERILTIEID